MKASSTPAPAIALLAVVLLLPAMGLPFLYDDLNSIYQAGVTLQQGSHLFDPWMGGLVRVVPKLLLIGMLEVAGPHSLPFRLLNYLLHGLSVLLLVRVVTRAAGSPAVGAWTGLWFALGLGYYARAVIQVSNLTMVCALTLLLAAIDAAQCGRRTRALVLFGLAALSHEVVWAAPLLLPLAPGWRAGSAAPAKPPPDAAGVARWILAGGVLLLAILLWIPGWPARLARQELDLVAFALLPVNAAPTFLDPHGLAARAAGLAVALRPVFRYGILALCLVAALRLRGVRATALAWALTFFLPVAALVATWPVLFPEDWLQRRYLYVPAIGWCVLLAAWLAAGGRRPPRFVLAALLVAWCLGWGGLTTWKLYQDADSPLQRANRARFEQAMGRLDARWAAVPAAR